MIQNRTGRSDGDASPGRLISNRRQMPRIHRTEKDRAVAHDGNIASSRENPGVGRHRDILSGNDDIASLAGKFRPSGKLDIGDGDDRHRTTRAGNRTPDDERIRNRYQHARRRLADNPARENLHRPLLHRQSHMTGRARGPVLDFGRESGTSTTLHESHRAAG